MNQRLPSLPLRENTPDSILSEQEILLISMTVDQATSRSYLLPILEEALQGTSTQKGLDESLPKQVNKGTNMQSLSFGSTPPQTRMHWTQLDILCLELESTELYLSLKEESLPTKFIILEASSLDKPSQKSSNSLTRLTYQLTRLLDEMCPFKKAYSQEEDMKSSSILKNKTLHPQSKMDIQNPISTTPLKSSNIYPMTSTKTRFIMTRNTDISTIEESSRDSSSKKAKTAFITNHFSTRRSMLDQTYQQLNSLNSSLGSNSKSLNY